MLILLSTSIMMLPSLCSATFPLSLLVLLILFISSSSAHSFHDDGQSLLAFKSLITIDPHQSMANWNPAVPFCNWTAVTCSPRHPNRVVALNLTGVDLRGTISPSLGNLSFLQWLDLSKNALYGHIPSQLGRLFRLRMLSLRLNQLEGSIPVELGYLGHLQFLYLGTNNLTGTIPSSIVNLSALITLGIAENHLHGALPPQLGLLTSLQTLYVHTNELSGNIPESLSNVPNLRHINLWENQLTGKIPNSIGNCSKLKILSLAFNNMSGSVPLELGNLFLLDSLYLQSNQLDSGSSTDMSFLVHLNNCSRLGTLVMSSNILSGVLPLTIGRLSSNLSYLDLSNNNIEGNIPLHITNLTSLTYLDLSSNLLNGSIPSLRNFEKLERLHLGYNKLEGNIPNDFKPLKHLGLLSISENMLYGKIPDSLGHLKQLRFIYLHGNYLSDKIPASLGDCQNLALLDLSHNRLTGSIPREVATLPHLNFYLNLSWNFLDGPIPLEIGKLEDALAIEISANLLIGVIPTTLGSCIALESLNLSNNSLKGLIPDSLGNLQNLFELDLSSNSLSGTIPIILNHLKSLHYLNLSFNNFRGEISEGGFFANQTLVMSLIGNPELCGPQVFSLPTCPTPRSHFEVLKKVILPIVGAIGFILCCLLLGFLWRGNLDIQNLDLVPVIFQKLEHQRISYQEISEATNGFAESNLLGHGNFGSVYKGVLNNGTLVAVKIFNLQNLQFEKSFKAECNILQKVRHRNLVRIITSCSNFHFKGLVFEFMCNGSLDNHLYPNKNANNNEDVCQLGLKIRLGIAIDVAHALEYLHHDSFVQVVHCDIKPSNVLLDEGMVGHLTDFGIARFVGAPSNDSLTSTLGLKGTMGYIAPEYGLGERVSTQGDVYSYGILLLEMFTRKRPSNDMFAGDLNLHKWVDLAFPNRVKEVIESGLLNDEVEEYQIEENDVYKCLQSLLHISLLCSKHSPKERPTMREVSTMLERLKKDLVENTIAPWRFRQSISSLIASTSATLHNVVASNDQSSTF